MPPELVKTVVLGLFAALVIGAAVRDLATFTIPNWISLALALALAPAALLMGASLPDIGVSLAVGVGMLVVGAAMFALGWIGGGDANHQHPDAHRQADADVGQRSAGNAAGAKASAAPARSSWGW